MKKTILSCLMLAGVACSASAISIPDSLNYTARIGYNIGGTAPIGMPATIRKMNSYKIVANVSYGIDVQKDLWDNWGLLTGIHLENKGMEIDATVKNYHMEMVRGGERIEGRYTGRLVTKCDEWMLTLPVMATYRAGRWLFKGGPYVSYLTTKHFDGYVYDGYLREGDPTGPKVEMGNEEGTRGTYDFGSDMRRWQFGVDLGVDCQITKRFGLYADITWGLTGIHRSSFKTIEQTLYPIFGTIGVMYKLK